MRKISYLELQKKYPKKIVALDREEKSILAVGKKFKELFRRLKENKINPKNAIFIGPIQKQGTINVYLSLSYSPQPLI